MLRHGIDSAVADPRALTGKAVAGMHAPSVPRWYLLRHARPLVAEGVCYGQSDIPADAQGTLQAASAFVHHWQVMHGGQGTRVQLLSSPLRRCLQLAQSLQPLLIASDCEMQHRTRGALAEIDFGNWEGQPWNALPAAVWQDWQADFAHYRPGGGESTAHLLQRVRAAAGSTARWLRRHDEAVAIWVTHAGGHARIALAAAARRRAARCGHPVAVRRCMWLRAMAGAR
jgi:alpha-ribazole phosphatase